MNLQLNKRLNYLRNFHLLNANKAKPTFHRPTNNSPSQNARANTKHTIPNSKTSNHSQNSLKPDPVLKTSELKIDYEAEENILRCIFSGISDRVIRVSISNVLDNLKTVIECIDEFEGKKDSLWELDEVQMNG